MKHVVSVTMGSSTNDFTFETDFLGQPFTVSRVGADGDESQAWELLRRHQAKADAIGLGMIRDHHDVGTRRIVHADTERMLGVVTRVPATTGAALRRLLQVRAVRHVQKQLGNFFNNNKVLFLSGVVNYDMAVAMADYTPNLRFADAVLQTGAPKMLTSLNQLEVFARGARLAESVLPLRTLSTVMPGLSAVKSSLVRKQIRDSHTVVGTFDDLKQFMEDGALKDKTVITSAVDDERFAAFKRWEANLVVDVSPTLFDHVVGTNTIQAMILAALNMSSEELADADLEDIIRELAIKPRLLHPTGEFRNIRRFAFVIHPLSQEYITKGFPLPKATPKVVMDKVEQAAAHMPPMVYSKMSNIVSPAGAEAEGWLITVGGTPREMLARSPEFTYRRLLMAASMAQKMGAQIIGLGAFTKVVGDAGVTVARRAEIPVTTGNSYSASGALWAAADAVRRMGLVKINKNQKIAGKTMVVGATGSIGSVSARLLAMAVDEVYLAGRNMKKLEALKASMLKDTPQAKIVATTNYEDHLHEMDMIVTSTSGAGKKILDITKVKPGCVITDVARPLDLPPEEVAKRPDVLVIESGEIELPTDVKMKDIGLPPNVIYACLAETIVLALEGRFEVFTIGRDTEWEKVKEIYKLGLKHGMKLAAISGVNGVFTDEDIAEVKRLALEARKNWTPGQATRSRPESRKKDAAA
ncbi:dehydrogenase [Abyssibacter profundi]|uniref:Dehydrogenase n=1 Tax=Abyssibacter profundi TaxID=2182787 RepID=A0A363UJH3_9GAMM|nr:dehydrogenase [Abyssibacter profundi]PWN55517.1 dehydrogenase [Abyssibacter profundi]